MNWNDERVALFRKLWDDGLSASQIASRLGGVTRNAVLGKAFRLGMTRAGKPRHTYARTAGRPRTKSRRIFPKWLQLVDRSTPAVEPDIPPHERKTLLVRKDGHLHANDALTNDCCRWPCGDPQHADFGFCGRPKVDGVPYCADHARIAYRPPMARRSGQPFLFKEKFEPQKTEEQSA